MNGHQAGPCLGRGSVMWTQAPSTAWCFVDRLMVTLVHLRHGVIYDALTCWFGVEGPISWAVGEVLAGPADRTPPVTRASATTSPCKKRCQFLHQL
ncbi:transposase family protein [Streptomyces sp. 1222.5]|uniref:transposase family protein n=1 Tax=Streptomyces sp. 1222.5 TaxID=1881026 RepID=UPI003EBEBEF7